MKCVLLNVLTWHSAGIIAQNPPQRKNVKYEYHSYIKKKGGGGGGEKVASSEDKTRSENMAVNED